MATTETRRDNEYEKPGSEDPNLAQFVASTEAPRLVTKRKSGNHRVSEFVANCLGVVAAGVGLGMSIEKAASESQYLLSSIAQRDAGEIINHSVGTGGALFVGAASLIGTAIWANAYRKDR